MQELPIGFVTSALNNMPTDLPKTGSIVPSSRI